MDILKDKKSEKIRNMIYKLLKAVYGLKQSPELGYCGFIPVFLYLIYVYINVIGCRWEVVCYYSVSSLAIDIPVVYHMTLV